jgi:hypothetical protein
VATVNVTADCTTIVCATSSASAEPNNAPSAGHRGLEINMSESVRFKPDSPDEAMFSHAAAALRQARR